MTVFQGKVFDSHCVHNHGFVSFFQITKYAMVNVKVKSDRTDILFLILNQGAHAGLTKSY